jgi:hypothetical protein
MAVPAHDLALADLVTQTIEARAPLHQVGYVGLLDADMVELQHRGVARNRRSQ